LFSLITGIKTKMLLIVFLGLLAKLALVCSGCDVETLEGKSFDWTKVDISVLTRITKQAALKPDAWVVFHFGSIKNSQYNLSERVLLNN
jgi:hypothetical protein